MECKNEETGWQRYDTFGNSLLEIVCTISRFLVYISWRQPVQECSGRLSHSWSLPLGPPDAGRFNTGPTSFGLKAIVMTSRFTCCQLSRLTHVPKTGSSWASLEVRCLNSLVLLSSLYSLYFLLDYFPHCRTRWRGN